MAEYSNFVRSNQKFSSKSGVLGKKVAVYSKWRYNQEWCSIYADTIPICHKIQYSHFTVISIKEYLFIVHKNYIVPKIIKSCRFFKTKNTLPMHYAMIREGNLLEIKKVECLKIEFLIMNQTYREKFK